MKEKCSQGEVSLRDYAGQRWRGSLRLSRMQLSQGKACWMGAPHTPTEPMMDKSNRVSLPEVLKARVTSTRSVVTSHGTG